MNLWILQHFSSFGESRGDTSGFLSVKLKPAQYMRLDASAV